MSSLRIVTSVPLEQAIAALHSLSAHRMRSLLTILGVLIGIATMTTVTSLLQGFGGRVTDSLDALGTSTITIRRNAGPAMGGGPGRSQDSRPELEADYAGDLASLEGVTDVVPVTGTFASVKSLDGAEVSASLMGTDAGWLDVAHRGLSAGRFLTDYEISARRDVCILGADLAERLFEDDDPLEAEILVQGVRLLVVGVLEHQGQVMGMDQDDVVIVPWTIFGQWEDPGPSMSLMVEIEDPAAMDSMLAEIGTRMRTLRGLGRDEEDDFELMTAEELREGFSSVSKWLFISLLGLSGLSLLVGSVGIANIMLVSVAQRTREIGLRKALGATSSRILGQFLAESLLLALVGGVAGILTGIVGAAVASSLTGIPAGLQAWSVAAAVGVSGTTGILAGIVPAGRAARMEPLAALRR